MLKRIIEYFSGIKMTIVSTCFLLVSLYGIITRNQILYDFSFLTIIISGSPIVYKAYNKLIYYKKITSPLLVTIAMASAIIIGEYFAAGEVALIMTIGEILEDITVDKTKKGLERLISLTPLQGRKIFADGHEEILELKHIQIGDTLRVLSGETIPTDGIVIDGCSSVNQANLTGESVPVDKNIGDEVMAGTINCCGSIDIVVKEITNTYLQKMINLVEQAQDQKAPIQKVIDRWASILIPSALCVAILTYIFTGEIIRAVTVLVVFCPCAMILATPTAVMATIGRATKDGIMIKSGESLEIMSKIDTVVFDKTGTLTEGKISVSDIISFDDKFDEDTILAYLASVEQLSEHSLGKTIVSYAKEKNIAYSQIKDFKMIVGKGVLGKVDDKFVLAGNTKLLNENNLYLTAQQQEILDTLQQEGKANIIIAIDNNICGVIALSDYVRTGSLDTVLGLTKLNITPFILTGDNQYAAQYLAHKVKINNIIAELLPEGKVLQIQQLQKEGHIICMVGDGVNDSPALKTANIGIAMGGIGSDISIDAADIVLINDNICSLPFLAKLSRLMIKTITQNISISLILNLVGIVLSIIGFLTPMTGAIMHNIGSIVVVLHSAHLYNTKIN